MRQTSCRTTFYPASTIVPQQSLHLPSHRDHRATFSRAQICWGLRVAQGLQPASQVRLLFSSSVLGAVPTCHRMARARPARPSHRARRPSAGWAPSTGQAPSASVAAWPSPETMSRSCPETRSRSVRRWGPRSGQGSSSYASRGCGEREREV